MKLADLDTTVRYPDYSSWETAAKAAGCSIIKTRMKDTDCWAQGKDDRWWYGYFKNGGTGIMKLVGERTQADIERYYA